MTAAVGPQSAATSQLQIGNQTINVAQTSATTALWKQFAQSPQAAAVQAPADVDAQLTNFVQGLATAPTAPATSVINPILLAMRSAGRRRRARHRVRQGLKQCHRHCRLRDLRNRPERVRTAGTLEWRVAISRNFINLLVPRTVTTNSCAVYVESAGRTVVESTMATVSRWLLGLQTGTLTGVSGVVINGSQGPFMIVRQTSTDGFAIGVEIDSPGRPPRRGRGPRDGLGGDRDDGNEHRRRRLGHQRAARHRSDEQRIDGLMAATDTQTAVVALQEALNQRAAPRGYPPLNVDGILGPLTKMAVQDLGHALGIEPELLAAEQLAPAVLQLFVDPRGRSAAQVTDASDRTGQLEAHEIELDGVQLAWGLVKPLVRARAAGWEGSSKRWRPTPSCSSACSRAQAWWHKVIEASNEGQLESILTEMGYACELVAHRAGPLGRSGLRFIEQPGAVEPGGTAGLADPTAPSAPSAGTVSPPDPTAPSAPTVPPDPTAPSSTTAAAAITGPDVSASQGAIDWNAVAAAGHGFAFIRATLGVNTVDERFASNWQGAGAAGLRRSAYHVAAPQPGRDPGDEAVNLVSALRSVGTASDADLPPSAAIDDLVNAFSSEQARDWLRAFSAVFERVTQQLPAIRMTADSFARTLDSEASAIKSPVWLSGATSSAQGAAGLASFEPLPDDADCPGVDGPCELSRFAGSRHSSISCAPALHQRLEARGPMPNGQDTTSTSGTGTTSANTLQQALRTTSPARSRHLASRPRAN